MMRRIVSLPFLHTPVADRRALLTPVPLSGTAQTGRPNPVHRVNARTGRIRYCRDCDYGYRGGHFPTPRHSYSGFAATAAVVDDSVESLPRPPLSVILNAAVHITSSPI